MGTFLLDIQHRYNRVISIRTVSLQPQEKGYEFAEKVICCHKQFTPNSSQTMNSRENMTALATDLIQVLQDARFIIYTPY